MEEKRSTGDPVGEILRSEEVTTRLSQDWGRHVTGKEKV